MWRATVLAVLACAIIVSGQKCDPSKCNVGIHRYYTDLGCRPVPAQGDCCPSKFDCTAALSNRGPEKCHLKGVAYAPGATITAQQVGDPCVAECRCNKFGVEANFLCVTSQCPEMEDRLEDGCARLYAHNTCCATGTHCGASNATTTGAKKAFTCNYAGKTYVVGQKFYPADNPCKNCICQQGFDGTLNGPWCTDVTCSIEVYHSSKIRAGCAPIYFGQRGCCPIGWRCPTAQDTVVRGSTTGSPKSGPECTFGSLRLKVSDKLNAEKPCVECKCTKPPHVECNQRGYC